MTSIETIRGTLANTIRKKQKLLDAMKSREIQEGDIASNLANNATIQFLSINLDELRAIYADLCACRKD